MKINQKSFNIISTNKKEKLALRADNFETSKKRLI